MVNVRATYVNDSDKKVKILSDGGYFSVEEYAENYYKKQGYTVLVTESVPFHVIFSVFFWYVVQDPCDDSVRMVSFGERSAYEDSRIKNPISVPLPDDFGTLGYGKRRADVIKKHLTKGFENKDDILWLFDYWLPYSEGLRHYLWAHRKDDEINARKVVEVLPIDVLMTILGYLIGNYWGRYLGWPDLLLFKGGDFRFVEVKSSRDKLSEDQKRWVRDNHEQLRLPFEILKIHRETAQQKH